MRKARLIRSYEGKLIFVHFSIDLVLNGTPQRLDLQLFSIKEADFFKKTYDNVLNIRLK